MTRILDKARMVPSLRVVNMEHYKSLALLRKEVTQSPSAKVVGDKKSPKKKLRKTKSTKSKVRFQREPQLMWPPESVQDASVISISENIEREII
jgi:hypothetical protein